MTIRLILASQSPRRRELLQQIGIQFSVVPSDFEEKMGTRFAPSTLVEQNALGKSLDVQKKYPNALILGADTIVVINGQVVGKPTDNEDAVKMLQSMEGRHHTVHTGVALLEKGRWCVRSRVTRVMMRSLTEAQIRAYVATGEPMDKAGSYAIQGIGASFVESIEGCYTNVVGLSLPLLFDMFKEFDRVLF